jgi:hypothetical protein
MLCGWQPLARFCDASDFMKQRMRAICREKSMKPVRMTGNDSDRAEPFQFILDSPKRQTAVAHQLPNVTRASFASKEQSENLCPGFRKQNFQKCFL